jgi:hypothetical protein
MKQRFYSLLIVLTAAILVFAADPVLNVHQTNSRVQNFVLANIDSLTVARDVAQMKVHKKDGTLSDVDLNSVDSVVFAEGTFSLPVVELMKVTFNYDAMRATCQVNVKTGGGCQITERGICWATHSNPSIKDSVLKAQSSTVGQYISFINGINIDKTYYIRSYASNCAGTSYSEVTRLQPLMGNVTYTLAQSVIDAGPRVHSMIKQAMDSALYYYNRYTPFRANIWVYYNSGIPTAQASYHGSIGFGSNERYMYVGTAMHEMAHYFGSGTTDVWKSKLSNGIWQGPVAQALCQQLTGSTLKGDNNNNPQHYWPTGINQREEVKNKTDLINHARVVKAMLVDDCKLPTSW